jgi:hypothetical protein
MNGPVVVLIAFVIAFVLFVIFERSRKALDRRTEERENREWLASRRRHPSGRSR